MLTRIEATLAQLRPSERKLATYVLDVPREVVDLSMNALAERAGVSQPTIARFCMAVGCSGFREFKIRLAQSIAQGVPFVHRDVRPDEPVSGIAGKVLDRTIGSLMQVRNNLSPDSIGAAIDRLAHANRIEFYGAGASGIAALDMQHKFFRLGIPAVAYNDPHVYGMSAALLREGDCVVAISNTGRSQDVLEAAQLARDAGATVIAITHSNSPLARLASIALFADVDEDTDVYSPLTSRIAHLAIGDVLAVGVALRLGTRLPKQLARAKEVINRRRTETAPR
ncbi:HTH-type transcriptional regulator HexR [Pandoraea terrae]|uniref:HTH-type transcriptional regulator HexR n=1 Tax=Pandoraea terrae TaxID=1537710 RepID=A0A5E4U0E9_9BURK|nr:SIS domain-containing protein [Pandoraea terrae]VVD93550.1 HTH-type transcriptional regulator HexR [Pandoraea terrae]